MDHINVPDLMAHSDSEDDDVQTLQSKWLNDDGMHEMKTSHDGIYSPKGLETELNRKSAAKFLKYLNVKIVTVMGHAGFGACGLHSKAPGCTSILKPNNINQSVRQHGKTCKFWINSGGVKKRVADEVMEDSPALHARGTGPFGVKSMLMQGGALLRSTRQRCWSGLCLGTGG